jgi:hypothetical protein
MAMAVVIGGLFGAVAAALRRGHNIAGYTDVEVLAPTCIEAIESDGGRCVLAATPVGCRVVFSRPVSARSSF